MKVICDFHTIYILYTCIHFKRKNKFLKIGIKLFSLLLAPLVTSQVISSSLNMWDLPNYEDRSEQCLTTHHCTRERLNTPLDMRNKDIETSGIKHFSLLKSNLKREKKGNVYHGAIIDSFSNSRNSDNRPFRIIESVLSAPTDTKYTMDSLILS